MDSAGGIFRDQAQIHSEHTRARQHMHNHTCTFDYKGVQRSTLRERNPEVVPAKL